MGLKGRLTKDKMGFSMPVDGPSYPKLPHVMRDVETISIDYETDVDAALAHLPEADGLELSESATARVMFVSFSRSTWGGYDEIYQVLDCVWQGQPCVFPVRLLLNAYDSGLFAGRELYGNPKKIGHVEFTKESNIIQATGDRPYGTRICTGMIQPEEMFELESGSVDVLGLRVMPNPENPKKPSLSELLMNTNHMTPIEAWKGPGSLFFSGVSELDPWHHLPIKKLGPAVYTLAHIKTTSSIKIVAQL